MPWTCPPGPRPATNDLARSPADAPVAHDHQRQLPTVSAILPVRSILLTIFAAPHEFSSASHPPRRGTMDRRLLTLLPGIA